MIHKMFLNIKRFIAFLFSPLIKRIKSIWERITSMLSELTLLILEFVVKGIRVPLRPAFRLIISIYKSMIHPILLKIKNVLVKLRQAFQSLVNDVKSLPRAIKNKLKRRDQN